MSVVPETLPARALGMRVLALASLTNALGEEVGHDEVVRVANETAIRVGRLLVDLLPRIADTEAAGSPALESTQTIEPDRTLEPER
jgi:hypothetical protein